MNRLNQEVYVYFRKKLEETYLDFVKTALTISAATIAAIVIFSGRFDSGQIPFFLRLSMVGFLFSIFCGVALQFYICIDISSFLDRLEKDNLVQEDVHIDGSIRMKSSRKFLFFALLHFALFFLSFSILAFEFVLYFWKGPFGCVG